MIGDPWRHARRDSVFIGQEIRYRRTLAGMTQGDLGELIGLDAPQMSRIERGETIPFTHQALTLWAWLDEQTRLQTVEGHETVPPALPYRIVFPTPPRATHPDTSRKAMDSVNRDNAWAIHQWIIEQLEDFPEGLTHEQLWERHVTGHPDWFPSGIDPPPRSSQSGLRTRVSELVRGGVVQDSGRTSTMTTGRQAIVWVLADQAGATSE